jgi:hypothetical protein
MSQVGAGANLVTNPDAPVNIFEVLASRTLTTLGIQWSDGPYNGGDYILDYRVWRADQSGVYQIDGTGLLTTQYKSTGLTPGVTYTFKV